MLASCTTTVPGPGPTSTTTDPPFNTARPTRVWSVHELRGDALEDVTIDEGIDDDGDFELIHDFGGTSRDFDLVSLDGTTRPSDGIANGQVASAGDGSRFWVGAEAPAGVGALPDGVIGSETHLRQLQSFAKRTEDATLSVTIGAATLEVTDRNAALGRRCPPVHEDGLRCPLVEAETFVWLQAYTVPPEPVPVDTFFSLAGGATLTGFAENWDSTAWTPRYSRRELWNVEDFDFAIEDLDDASEGLVTMSLREPHTFEIDLSGVDVGQAFTLDNFVSAAAFNRIAGPPSEFETSASAFFTDPDGGRAPTVTFTGLDPIETPDVDPVDAPVLPAPCVTGVDPTAGSLQFAAPAFSVAESDRTPQVVVTREGGTNGAVTATFATGDGTATADTDYRPVRGSVFFADGDDEPRVVEVLPINDDIGGEPDRTVELTLSDPGGCAALGDPSTAVLTIRDDDPAPPPPPSGFVLDPTFDGDGTASVDRFGGDRSAMALTPGGGVMLVGGTFTDFIGAHLDGDGALDAAFDDDGKVTTDVGGGFEQEEALGVSVQPDDGKIVAAGYSGDSIAVVRYLTDGRLDPGFADDGIAHGDVPGLANDVALQSDGSIVVAGRAPAEVPTSDDFDDVVVARYRADGQLDTSFGDGGFVRADVGAVDNQAENVVVLDDGSIVVSGSARDPGSNGVGIDHHTDVLKFDRDGRPDGGFGSGGQLTLPDTFVGADLAVQSDGGLVLIGTLDGAPTELVVMRLEPDGDVDATFGEDGTARPGISGTGTALAVQVDDAVVVAGTSSTLNQDMVVGRLTPDGDVDETFSSVGVVTIDFFRLDDVAESVAVQDDGRIVISGLATDAFGGYGVARLAPAP